MQRKYEKKLTTTKVVLMNKEFPQQNLKTKGLHWYNIHKVGFDG